MSISWRRLAGALVPLFLFAGCGGGGGGGTTITFTLAGVNPAVSSDLSGGDLVTITGTNFQAAGVTSVTFGGAPGVNPQVLSETDMTVLTPAAPGGVAGAVTVAVSSTSGGTRQLTNGYTYSSSGPSPATIAPAIFTPTGAENFTITGTSLGPFGGQVTVVFGGIGSVTGTVSPSGTSITGRAPVAAGVTPIGGITVTVDTGSATADVPTPVSYSYSPPGAVGVMGVPFQTIGNASQPVRLADGFAVMCTSGANLTWGDADDDIKIIKGPPNAISVAGVPPRGAPGTPVGYLSPTNSIPVILSQDTFCVYTAGPPGPGIGPGFALVTSARTAPVADVFGFPGPAGGAGINAAPIAAIGPSRIAFMAAGVDGVFGPFGPPPFNQGDDLVVVDFNLAFTPPAMSIAGGGTARVVSGIADLTPGPLNLTIPFTADGDTVFVMGAGPDAIPRTMDDTILAHVVSTNTTSVRFAAPALLGRPVAFSSSLLAAPGAGADGIPGNTNDTVEVFTYTGPWVRTPTILGQAVNAAAPVPYARLGNGIAVVVGGGIRIFTNPAAGTNINLPFLGVPLLAPLGNGGLLAFGPGGDLAYRTTDDQAVHIDATATTVTSFSLVPNQFQVVAPLSDPDRVFALSPGPDGAFQTIDDTLEVYQSRSLGQLRSASQLPISAQPVARVTGARPFVPIGPGWGLLQSPGTNAIFGDADDQLILATY